MPFGFEDQLDERPRAPNAYQGTRKRTCTACNSELNGIDAQYLSTFCTEGLQDRCLLKPGPCHSHQRTEQHQKSGQCHHARCHVYCKTYGRDQPGCCFQCRPRLEDDGVGKCLAQALNDSFFLRLSGSGNRHAIGIGGFQRSRR